ncbi:MAG: T9SS type A sorting domain-containing protein [Bacteroidota bacterium]
MKNLLLLLLCSFLLGAELPNKHHPQIFKTAAATRWKHFDGNTIRSVIADDGVYSDSREDGHGGVYWPKDSSSIAMYTAGLIIVGKHQPTNKLRTAAEYFRSELQPGPILGTFNTSTNDVSVAADRNDTTYRIYKITIGDNAVTNPDFANWPGDLGAPYHDVNNNGQWDKGIDTPQLLGDQMLWSVVNDLDTAAHESIGASPPMGLEIQTAYYGFNRSAPVGNTMLIQWKIINKSDAQYDSLFVGMFSDVDMGDGGDDVTGYDTTLSLAYVYNGDDFDGTGHGYGSTPPSVGTLFLEATPAVQPYSHTFWVKTLGDYSDLPMGGLTFPQSVFNYARGLSRDFAQPYVDPVTNQQTRFAFTGDPVTNQGWTWAVSQFLPGDARSFFSLGPITLAPGDTQEVNAAFIISRGSDRLHSITLLRNYAAEVKAAYQNNFLVTVADNEQVLTDFTLEQNFPNPFNPTTTIKYTLPTGSFVTIAVYNVLGQKVKTLISESRDKGSYQVFWDGTDDANNSVAGGIYFYRLETNELRITKRMLLLK